MRQNATILVIDDDDAIRRSLQKVLQYEGYDVVLAQNGSQGVNLALAEDPQLILLDIKMPKMDGIEVLQTLIKQGTKAPVVMISGHGTVQTAVEATRLGAFDFLEKPLDRDRLLLVCRNALERHVLEEENQELRVQVESKFQAVGEHPKFKSLLERIDRVAPTKATVLILGESGTGKELIARQVHEQSGRKGRFVQVNCAAIPQELIESELFGHVKGAFTGAVDHQKGKFQMADKGSIFLDEIADMSLNTQAKVLRVLQEGEVEPVGSGNTKSVDVRIIAATNKNLDEMIKAGTFREDLFFRLNVVPIESVPLRERRSDIALLIESFRKEFIQIHNLKSKPFSTEALDYLKSRQYRGNIRELKNLVERMMILGEDEVIREKRPLPNTETINDTLFQDFKSLREFKEEMERRFLLVKLRMNKGNISRTAEDIDTPRSNLYKKLEQYKIQVNKS